MWNNLIYSPLIYSPSYTERVSGLILYFLCLPYTSKHVLSEVIEIVPTYNKCGRSWYTASWKQPTYLTRVSTVILCGLKHVGIFNVILQYKYSRKFVYFVGLVLENVRV
jgi:hypothetical protein